MHPDAVLETRSVTGTFQFLPATFEQLPTLCHVVDTLAGLGAGVAVDAGEIRTRGWADAFDIAILGSGGPIRS